MAKNLTVNFNRRGRWSALNSWFTFFNAGVQGTAQLLYSITTSKEVAGIVVGQFLIGYMMEMYNAANSGDEDDDGVLDHDETANHILERNFVIHRGVTGADKDITIPLPYGYNVFFYMGAQLAKVQRGVKTQDESVPEVLRAAGRAFSPVMDDTLTRTLSPTLTDLLLELATNENWQQRQIRPEERVESLPQSYSMHKNPPPWPWPEVADAMNRASGGSEFDAGWIDVSPEYLDHIWGQVTGGAGRTASQLSRLGEMVWSGDWENVETYQIPLWNKVVYDPGDYVNQSRFFEQMSEVETAAAIVRAAERKYKGKWKEAIVEQESAEFLEKIEALNSLRHKVRAANKTRKVYQGRIDDVFADTSLSRAQQRDLIKKPSEERDRIYREFSKRFVKVMGPQSE